MGEVVEFPLAEGRMSNEDLNDPLLHEQYEIAVALAQRQCSVRAFYPKAIAAVPISTTMPNPRAIPHRNWKAKASRIASTP
jgi:hypothetical protein